MRIVIAGASGLIGTALAARLARNGHDVVRLVRRPARGPLEAQWDPATGTLDEAVLAGADAVVNLSGAGIGDRPWTKRRIRKLFASRLQPTHTLVSAMARLDTPPATFISQSASGYYGSVRTGPLREDSGPGAGVLANLCVEWEEAANRAPAGVRVVTPRTGIILSRSGGALRPLILLLKFGLGGPFGNGRQHWPWITLHDEAAALEFLLTSRIAGAVNVCAPDTTDVNTIVRRLAVALHRPSLFRVPSPLLHLALGRLADELILANQPMDPSKLADAGFTWQHPSLPDAVAWIAAR